MREACRFLCLLATAPRTLDWLQFNGQSSFPRDRSIRPRRESGKGVFEQAPLESVFGLTPCRNGGDSPLLPWPTMGFPLRSINDAPYNALRLNDLAMAPRFLRDWGHGCQSRFFFWRHYLKLGNCSEAYGLNSVRLALQHQVRIMNSFAARRHHNILPVHWCRVFLWPA